MKNNQDLTPEESEKCEKDTIVFNRDNCITKMLDYLLKLKGDEKKLGHRAVE